MKVIYSNRIKSLGSCVDEFKDSKMFILFGDNAPDTLKDFCYSIDVIPIDGEIKAGQKVVINGKDFLITSVGDVVMKNLESLGHVTFVFDGSITPELPGSIYVEDKEMPIINAGTVIEIIE